MVDLPTVSNGIVTSTAPTSAITSGVIEQQANQRAGAYGKVADDLMDVSTDLAKNQAADDLMNQKITRNADGSVNVENPASAPLIFGDAGKAYTDAVKVGTLAQHANNLSETFTDLHTQYPTDPVAFKSAADAYLTKIAQTVTGPIGQAVQAEGQQLLTQHYNAITNTAASNDIDNQKKSLALLVDDRKNTAIAIARQDGTGTDAFKTAYQQYEAGLDQQAANPLFKTPPEQVALEKKNTYALMQGEALNAQIDTIAKTRDGKATAQAMLKREILENPDMKETDRNRLYAQGMSRLSFLTEDARIAKDANRDIISNIQTALGSGGLRWDDPSLGMAIRHSEEIGDHEGALKLQSFVTTQQQIHPLRTLPNEVSNQIIGVPHNNDGKFDPSIPEEAKPLLNRIGATESGNQYDVRYGGGGDKRFTDFTDHPRIAEPITSGPDVGKTSTAAGRYQFLAPTWDAEKAKLNLPDFSPDSQDKAAWDLAQTEYRAKTGKDLLTVLKSGDTGDVLPSLSGRWSSLPGGRQPARAGGVPSINGGPAFTEAQVRDNPFLLSSYANFISRDAETRVRDGMSVAKAAGISLDKGILPDPSAAGLLNQLAAQFPEKMGTVADELRGRIDGFNVAMLPPEQRKQYTDAVTAATTGPDIHQAVYAKALGDQIAARDKAMAENPQTTGANNGWAPKPVPFDPAHPETVAASIVQRAVSAKRIGEFNHAPPVSIFDKGDDAALQAILQGPAGAQVLGQIGQALRPDEAQTLLAESSFRASLTGMSRSGDPVKMNAAYSFMDQQQRQNPLQFDRQFPEELKNLRTWQANLAFYTSDALAKKMEAFNSPQQVEARKASDAAATELLANVPPAKVVSKFSTGFIFGTTANAPAGVQVGLASGALKADYDEQFKEGFATSGDPTVADKFAMEKLNLKYAVSPTNGNRVTAFAPENYYPMVGGSHDWMAKQLDDAITQATGVDQTGRRTHLNVNELKQLKGQGLAPFAQDDTSNAAAVHGQRMYAAPRALVPDETTAADVSNRRPPSYQVIIQDPNGQWDVMTNPASGAVQRMRFDPAGPFAERAAQAQRAREVLISPANSTMAMP
jgi:muramidase (phage lysozyme)